MKRPPQREVVPGRPIRTEGLTQLAGEIVGVCGLGVAGWNFYANRRIIPLPLKEDNQMIGLAISILWLLIGVIVLLGVIWLFIYVIKLFYPLPATVEKAIWAIALILCLIGGLTLLAGGGGGFSHFSIR